MAGLCLKPESPKASLLQHKGANPGQKPPLVTCKYLQDDLQAATKADDGKPLLGVAAEAIQEYNPLNYKESGH